MAEGQVKRAGGLKTREAILAASLQLFIRQGYHATGMREIAHETGISLGAVYNHFTSKEEIIRQLLEEHNLYRAIVQGLNSAQGSTVQEVLEDGFANVMNAVKGRPEFAFLVFIDVLEFQARHVAPLAGAQIAQALAFFDRIVARGRENGDVRDVSPVVLTRIFMGMVLSSFIIENVLSVLAVGNATIPLRMQDWDRSSVDVFLNGILDKSLQTKGDSGNERDGNR